MPGKLEFAVDFETGLVYSRMGQAVAVPLPRGGRTIRVAGDLQADYELERYPLYAIAAKWKTLHWTDQLPVHVQNRHRQWWGLALLPEV